MPKVFQLWSSPDCQRLDVAESDKSFFAQESHWNNANGVWNFRGGVSKKTNWRAVNMYVRESLLEEVDIHYFNDSTLILEQRAKDVLSPVIESCGEVYEQPVEERMCYVFNVMRFGQDYQGDEEFPEDGLFYDLTGVNVSLVRLSWGTLRAISGVTPPELDFKLLVEKHNLKGLSFREVWDSENYVPYVAPAEDEDE